MMNQWTLDTLYHSVYGDPDLEQSDDICEEELYHHGVLGQSWGRRHGPPYPLDGVDKKIARAEAKRKREKERRLKKLQRAAKKARKLKKKQEKQEADTLKKKQKLVKSGDMDKIRKNADLFNNDELQYILERDAMKRGLGGEKERTTDEKFDLAMKRMGQIADIAVKGGQVFGALKQGAEMVSAFHGVKVKELEKEEKRLSTVQKEFDLRFKRDPEEAYKYLNKELGDAKYKGERDTKEYKLEDKAARALRREKAEADLKGIEDRAKQAKIDEKNAKDAEKQKERDYKEMRSIFDKKKANQEKVFKQADKQAKREEKEYQKGYADMKKDFDKRKAEAYKRATAGDRAEFWRQNVESVDRGKAAVDSLFGRGSGNTSRGASKSVYEPEIDMYNVGGKWFDTLDVTGIPGGWRTDAKNSSGWSISGKGTTPASSIDPKAEPMKAAASWVRNGQKFDIPLWYTDPKGQVHNTFQNVPKNYWK